MPPSLVPVLKAGVIVTSALSLPAPGVSSVMRSAAVKASSSVTKGAQGEIVGAGVVIAGEVAEVGVARARRVSAVLSQLLPLSSLSVPGLSTSVRMIVCLWKLSLRGS